MFTGEETAGGNVRAEHPQAVPGDGVQGAAEQPSAAARRARRSRSTRAPARSWPWCRCPSFDPNPLASHDTTAAQAAYEKLDKDPDKPLLNRAVHGDVAARLDVQGRSMAAAALQNGLHPGHR